MKTILISKADVDKLDPIMLGIEQVEKGRLIKCSLLERLKQMQLSTQ